MRNVNPIRDTKKLAQIKSLLKWDWRIRELLLYQSWLATALRISDILTIKVKDLIDEEWNINDFFIIKEKKTWKLNKITITPNMKDVIKLYKEKYPDICKNPDYFVFFRKKTFPNWIKPIWRVMSYIILNKIFKDVWLKMAMGCHSLRKSWWYHGRMNWIPLEIIQHKLNHSSLKITKAYLWITDDEIEEACLKLDL
jgi:integrase